MNPKYVSCEFVSDLSYNKICDNYVLLIIDPKNSISVFVTLLLPFPNTNHFSSHLFINNNICLKCSSNVLKNIKISSI